jgi:hypothetical protein
VDSSSRSGDTGLGESLSPLAFPDVHIPIDEILPPALIGEEPSDGKKRDYRQS